MLGYRVLRNCGINLQLTGMEKNMGHMKKTVVAVITAAMLCSVCVQAAGSIQLMQIQTLDQDISFYVRGIEGDVEEVSSTIGNVESKSVNVAKLQELNVAICTYIMIDNSVSVPEKSREGIKNLLTELVAAGSDNEKFAIAVFGESLNQITGYTNDYFQLKQCIADIEFNDQKTYLTDMIYDAVNGEDIYCEEGDYVRILLISDGADGDSVGYTEEELKTLLMSTHIPVYSLGVYNKKRSNNSQLEKMFALSRLTGGSGYIYDDIENVDTYNEMLGTDRNITVFRVTPRAESLDGSEKTVRLSFSSGGETVELVADKVRMAVEVANLTESAAEESEPVKESEPTETVISEERDGVSKQETKGTGGMPDKLILAIAIGTALLAAIAVAVLLLVKASRRKNRENKFEPIRNTDGESMPIGAEEDVSESTQMIDKNTGGLDGGSDTQLIWGNAAEKNCVITLKDVAVPERQYQGILKKILLIGKSSNCNIVVATDPAISRKHCSIVRRNGLYYLKDEESSNGTFVNDSQIMSETQIKNGDIIRIGRTKFEFSVNT